MIDDDDIDAPEDFDREPPHAEKPSLREVWENNPALKLVAIVVAGAILLGGYLVFFSKGDETRSIVNAKDLATAKQVPGKEAVDPIYQAALEQQNKKEAEQQLQHGGSALPVPIAIAKGGGLNVPEMPEKPNSDVLEEWKKVANAGRMKAAKEAIDEESAPVPEAVPAVQPIRPKPVVKEDPNKAKHLAEQMRVIIAAQAPAAPHSLTITPEQSAYTLQKKEEDAEKTAGAGTSSSASAASSSSSAANASTDATKTIVPAGSIAYAQLLNELNSDVQGPVLAQVLSGPFAGGRLIGKINVVQDYMVINFSTVVKDTVSYKVNGIALDEKTTLAGQATEVDNHYFERVVLPAAASFVTGYASSQAQTGSSATAMSGVGTEITSPQATTKQSLYQGLETAGQSLSNVLNQAASRPITVIVAKGTTMGVFFTDTVTTKDAMK